MAERAQDWHLSISEETPCAPPPRRVYVFPSLREQQNQLLLKPRALAKGMNWAPQVAVPLLSWVCLQRADHYSWAALVSGPCRDSVLKSTPPAGAWLPRTQQHAREVGKRARRAHTHLCSGEHLPLVRVCRPRLRQQGTRGLGTKARGLGGPYTASGSSALHGESWPTTGRHPGVTTKPGGGGAGVPGGQPGHEARWSQHRCLRLPSQVCLQKPSQGQSCFLHSTQGPPVDRKPVAYQVARRRRRSSG